ncbi:hypothetical protein F3J20_24195 [Paraburkholderia sp. Cy-641]|uniref:hypothetical protein n=1 Tax=Paraburkholderia sp. Cy-641 TaxID=2608337 RepID=UPI001424A45E|nr:hypothetical protein [Paraburkholderia sp. Cy-641]NIF80456.1 hypothetical protein [Paraburkholderia sp. Cy-641]
MEETLIAVPKAASLGAAALCGGVPGEHKTVHRPIQLRHVEIVGQLAVPDQKDIEHVIDKVNRSAFRPLTANQPTRRRAADLVSSVDSRANHDCATGSDHAIRDGLG